MLRRRLFLFAILVGMLQVASAQTKLRELAAKKINTAVKIDGKLEESFWSETPLATKMVEFRPNFGAIEADETRTEVYLVYDNTAVYIGGFCHEKRDSISKELVGRDEIGINDYVGVTFDTYLDKINGFGFFMTPLGEQFDAKYSNTAGEDGSWNAVWDCEAKIVEGGWTFEMRIPYSALRFVSKENQTWGLNITRNRKKAGKQFMWNPVDPKVNGFINQEGLWTGIEKIDAPVRLSFSPYLSAYLNHYPTNARDAKDWTSSVNGGMDVKYGISDAFTLDMTLVPDFGQVQSDNQVLNLTPFEVRYNENRAFFTEGTELFSKGNLFYSRRVGGTPVRFGNAYNDLGPNEYVYKNPTESKLLNATKISGRTRKGFGLGVFNAITKPMYATIRDSVSGKDREVQTGSLVNYNILVVDQTLKNNSSVSFINTSTIRNGKDADANVSAGLFDFNNKKNTFNVSGKFSLSQVMADGKNTKGYSHYMGVGKTGGRWNISLSQELADEKYDINDMGILFNNNYIEHYFWTAYRWLKPKGWYNNIQINYNANYSQLYKKIDGQKTDSRFQGFNTNINGHVQLKSLWYVGFFVGYGARGHDFYEPRKTGYAWKTPRRFQFNPWFETNNTKKYFFSASYFLGLRSIFNSPNEEWSFSQRYRFSDKLSISHRLYYNPVRNDAGYYQPRDLSGNPISLDNVVFTRRDLKTIENVLSAKYNFNNKSGITIRARHYWSKVKQHELYDLDDAGELKPSVHSALVSLVHQNFNVFNVDAVYTWQFAPGSFINIVWKDQGFLFDNDVERNYIKNVDRTITEPQNNNLSIKIIYYLDYLDFKKWKKKKDK